MPGSSGPVYNPYAADYEQSQGWPAAPYWAPPPPPPSNPHYSHVGGTSNYHHPDPPPFYPFPPPPRPSQLPQGSADFSYHSFHGPANPPSSHPSAFPYPPISSQAYPPLAYPSLNEPSPHPLSHLSTYPSSAHQCPPSTSQPATLPSPHAVQPASYYDPLYPSSHLTSPSLYHSTGSFHIDNRPRDSSYWQAEGSFSSTEHSFARQQHPHSLSHSDTWSCDPSHCDIPHDMARTPANGAVVPYSGDLRSLKYYLLYGSLDVRIHSATNLPNLDTFSESLRLCVAFLEPRQRAFSKLQESISKKITSDPYVSLVLKGATLARTRVINNSQDPVWEEHFIVDVAHKVADIELVVKDNDMVGAQYIGEVRISAERLLSKPIQEQFFDLLNKDEKPCKPGAQLKISLNYRPVDRDPLYRDGVGAFPDYVGVPKTYFPLRRGGRLTLYQDAHVSNKSLPEIKLARGMKFEHRSCWEDIFQAIVEAQHLIYIAGWSIYTKIKLVRDKDKQRDEAADKNLGELLKWKAQNGCVRVLLLVWDDKTSHAVINNVGVMATHDEETRKFFKHSGVKCLLAPRYADSKLSWVKQQIVGTIYTHHQKLVIVDTKGPLDKRRLTAFIGGLDLCDGRYDTPEHTLFCRLNTDFKDDYHNPTFPTKVESGGPRQPWHDLHCKIEGPAVYDVLRNFEQRWKKVSKWHGGYGDFLIDLDQKAWAIKDLNVTEESEPESWHIQVFRSIDSGSVTGFPKHAQEAEMQHLVGRKNIAIDMSIHTAYIKAIRSAQHFIYIENQYFLGSSFAWPSYKNAGADHLVPIELALKIVSKIKAREHFAVYVVIPMWPEGDPKDAAVQEILFFQSQTMEMMYTLIAECLKEEQLELTHHPTDFLNFFCLGNRELKRESEPSPSVPPAEGSSQAKALKSRRFMIYVHAKGMIVDDEYVIIGSANVNQRSMDGSRDTEIAMGAYQPHHTWARIHAPPRGQVYGYRMSLWAEHLQASESSFMEPWSSECVKKVQSLTEQYWKQFSAEEVTEMKGHLLPYPIKVERTGKVVPLPDFEVFPDVGGKVLGVSSVKLPDNLTA